MALAELAPMMVSPILAANVSPLPGRDVVPLPGGCDLFAGLIATCTPHDSATRHEAAADAGTVLQVEKAEEPVDPGALWLPGMVPPVVTDVPPATAQAAAKIPPPDTRVGDAPGTLILPTAPASTPAAPGVQVVEAGGETLRIATESSEAGPRPSPGWKTLPEDRARVRQGERPLAGPAIRLPMPFGLPADAVPASVALPPAGGPSTTVPVTIIPSAVAVPNGDLPIMLPPSVALRAEVVGAPASLPIDPPAVATGGEPAREAAQVAAAPAAPIDPRAPVAIPPLATPPPLPTNGAALAAASLWTRPHTASVEPARPTDEPLVAIAAATGAAAPMAIHAPDHGAGASLDMADHRWPERMIEHIEVLRDAADAVDTRIRLVPDRLGGIDLSIRHEGERVHVHFAADQAQTRALLADAQPRLAELAEARGLKLGGSSVGSDAPPQQQPRTPAPLPSHNPTRAMAQATEIPDDPGRLA